ncbi:glycyl radical protein [Marispirochaeta sp.]|jgi:pyruvate formate-lyase/glycerol dehydratase family glycyl radical enzyme|uniref:glycyl radical protein n=1 Tax=Marispirochaeta sp. TaxID=2038653 RepID=UPI0029C70C7E|nr:glycyl radical protein [Marispirochaeta sp.]
MKTQIVKASGYNPRIQRLRDEVINAKSTICPERARFYTEVYKEHADKPLIIRRALALSSTLENMTVFIEPDGLIVGNQASQLRAAPIFPEYAVEWIEKEINEFEKRPGDQFYPSREVKDEILDICEFWRGKTTLDKGRVLMGKKLHEIHEAGIIRAEGNLTSGDAHIAVNNEKILAEGLDQFIYRVRGRFEKENNTTLDGVKHRSFYQSLDIGLSALQKFIIRFADSAGIQADAGGITPQRSEELKEIEDICRVIAHQPPKTFRQALQLTYFIQLVLQIESNGHSVSLGRMDQYLYPFYAQDVKRGILTPDFAMELLENTWVKLLSIHKIRSWSHTRFSAGSPLYQNVTIGGQTPQREDAVNDLSYLILNSVGETKLTQPNLSVRFHKNMSDDFLKACLEVIQKGFGMPAFNNDEIVIPSFIELGVEPEDAYNYSAIGCIEVAVPGKWGYRTTGKHFLNFMRIFLAAMHDGTDPVSGKKFYPGIGHLKDFTSFDQVMEAWKVQVANYAQAGIAIDTAIDIVLEEEAPDIICSAFVDDCIERGKTIHEGGSKYDFVSGLQVGIANLGNSLATIKKMVFEDKTVTAEQLLKHMENDFNDAGGEELRQRILNEVPKFGNDDDYVDQLVFQAYMSYIEELDKYKTIRYGRGPIGCRYYAGTSSISANVPQGAIVPATPDGRHAGTPLAEGCSPSGGTDIKGPTAVFQSIGKLPTEKILGGVLLNQKVTPTILEDENNQVKLAALLRGFFAGLNGWHVQYNVVDRETLLDAQKHPDNHRDLVVRVAGYSAFFNTLSKDTQDDIIARTEQSL